MWYIKHNKSTLNYIYFENKKNFMKCLISILNRCEKELEQGIVNHIEIGCTDIFFNKN